MILLRKRILNRAKPKLINNRELSGEMFVHLIENYVETINNGAIPNI
jgi:hypothetical protein